VGNAKDLKGGGGRMNLKTREPAWEATLQALKSKQQNLRRKKEEWNQTTTGKKGRKRKSARTVKAAEQIIWEGKRKTIQQVRRKGRSRIHAPREVGREKVNNNSLCDDAGRVLERTSLRKE